MVEPAPPQPTGPVVHVIEHKPDASRGVLKLVRHHSTSTQAVTANAVLITQLYDEICSMPCGVPVDVSERPVFYFVRDGNPVTRGFRLTGETGEITLRVKPLKQGLYMAGLYLTVTLILPVGIPMLVAGAPKVWVADGNPENHGDFYKLPKAKF
ncbi:hypothetical protein ENSA5_34060 [Enhygromyxa salina]|uniref:Uncharacterized protein n=1 Tax=Enhygromyxa salina TaxID=215803 RepID=A0A2S9XX82_9BACT|nr:hypothetical protein ENSA5_34060 [Enhygromyxa salina]